MEFLQKFSSNFLDKIINRYSIVKNSGDVTEDDIDDLEKAKTKADLLKVLENFKEEVNDNKIVNNADLESIEALIKNGTPIEIYPKTSLKNEVQSEFDNTLHKDDGETETRVKLDQDNLDSGSYNYSVLQSNFKSDIIELDKLILNLTK